MWLCCVCFLNGDRQMCNTALTRKLSWGCKITRIKEIRVTLEPGYRKLSPSSWGTLQCSTFLVLHWSTDQYSQFSQQKSSYICFPFYTIQYREVDTGVYRQLVLLPTYYYHCLQVRLGLTQRRSFLPLIELCLSWPPATLKSTRVLSVEHSLSFGQ
jgi:hypothetical protein